MIGRLPIVLQVPTIYLLKALFLWVQCVRCVADNCLDWCDRVDSVRVRMSALNIYSHI